MFTGIIQSIAKVEAAERSRGSLFLTIAKPRGWQIKAGDSIATDGACLTVVKVGKNNYVTQLMPETLQKTYFDKTTPKQVNLEQSLRLADRLDGHLVLGHVDAVGQITAIRRRGLSYVYTISYPVKMKKLVAAKGSIAVDGISLTVVDVVNSSFSVSLVDYTLTHTTLGRKRVGDPVNLEFDVIAKYLQRLLLK